MRRSVFAKLDDLDPETRSAAEAAARKAGLRLEDWVSEILADRLARQSSPPPKKRPAAEDFETLIGRMAKSARHSVPDDADALQSDADAVKSIARWIERAEARLADSARYSSDHQDRMASAMSEALTALKDRLDTVERRVSAERSPVRIEFPVEEAVKALSPLADTLVGLRTDVSQLADRLDQSFSAASPGHRGRRVPDRRPQGRSGRFWPPVPRSTASTAACKALRATWKNAPPESPS